MIIKGDDTDISIFQTPIAEEYIQSTYDLYLKHATRQNKIMRVELKSAIYTFYHFSSLDNIIENCDYSEGYEINTHLAQYEQIINRMLDWWCTIDPELT